MSTNRQNITPEDDTIDLDIQTIDTETGEIHILESSAPSTIVEYNKVETGLAKLREKYDKPAPNPDTDDGYAELKAGISEMTKTRTTLEKIRKKIKQPVLDYCHAIDSEAKRIKEEIEKLEGPWKSVKKEKDERKAKLKAEREEKAQAKIQSMRDAPYRAMNAELEVAEAILQGLKDERCEDGFWEWTSEALQVKKRATEEVEKVIVQKKELEKMQAKAKERLRVQDLESRLQKIKDMGIVTRKDTIQTVKSRISELEAMVINEGTFEDYAAQAIAARSCVLEDLNAELPKMEAEDEKLRKLAEIEEKELEEQRQQELQDPSSNLCSGSWAEKCSWTFVDLGDEPLFLYEILIKHKQVAPSEDAAREFIQNRTKEPIESVRCLGEYKAAE